MCQVLEVSRSGYYDWNGRPRSQRQQKDVYLLKEIRYIHIESKGNYGAIKTWKALRLKGIVCGKHRVARVRKQNCIESKRRKRFKVTTNSKNTKFIAQDLLNRNFTTDQPNKVWVGDVTYIETQSGWLYLAILMDLYSRKVIGWSMSERNNKWLVINALEMALEQRMPESKVVHHTDRGSVYGSDEYQYKLGNSGLIPSMSRKADCYDNAVAESFFSTLKNELVYAQRFKSRNKAKSEIFKFIEIFYNRQRLHQSLGYITPEMMEQRLSFN